MKYGKIVDTDAIGRCPAGSLDPAHYRLDGTCQCQAGAPGFRDTQREHRGHDFLPPAGTVPPLGATEELPLADKIIACRYFCAAGDWWIAEMDPADGLAFGYAKLAAYPDAAEWGYVDLAELEALNLADGLVIAERDLHWEPRKFSEITEARQ